MQEVKFLIKRSIFLIALILLVSYAEASQIYVDKTNLNFDNLRRNGYESNTLRITSDSPVNLEVSYIILGDLRDSIYISSDKPLILNKDIPLNLLIEINPSNSIGNGIHTGSIIFTFTEKNGPEISTSISETYTLPYSVEITDKIIKQAIVKDISIDDINKNKPIIALVTLNNIGNIEISPRILLKFKDSANKIRSYSLESSEMIKPSETKTISFQQDLSDLEIGRYNLNSLIFLDSNIISDESQDFYILSENEPIHKINFIKLFNDDKINVNHEISINAAIKNNGPDTYVRLVGSIYQSNNLVSEFETSSELIKSDQDLDLVYKFKPRDIGVYYINAHLEYGERKSEEIGSAFEAVPESQSLKEVPLSSNPIIAIMLMMITIYTMVRIHQYRRKSGAKKR